MLDELPWKYGPSKPISDKNKGWVEVSKAPPHKLYWEEHGNPAGDPVMVLHGGPGIGCGDKIARFFDPKHYRIILFDQRGAKRSIPEGSLENNTTPDLVEDINKLRDHLKIEGKMHLMGGSWGTTLALVYAIAHPDKVKSMLLRGIFLARPQEINFIYQGDAADPGNRSLMNAGRYFAEDWKKYVDFIPAEERGDMVKAYNKRLFSDDPEVVRQAAMNWCRWESATNHLRRCDSQQDVEEDEKDPNISFARIESHYFMNGSFLPTPNYILENIDTIKDIPIEIVQGRLDMICPRDNADDLVTAWNKVQPIVSKRPKLHICDAGHTYKDVGNLLKTTEIADRFRYLPQGKNLNA